MLPDELLGADVPGGVLWAGALADTPCFWKQLDSLASEKISQLLTTVRGVILPEPSAESQTVLSSPPGARHRLLPALPASILKAQPLSPASAHAAGRHRDAGCLALGAGVFRGSSSGCFLGSPPGLGGAEKSRSSPKPGTWRRDPGALNPSDLFSQGYVRIKGDNQCSQLTVLGTGKAPSEWWPQL